MAMEFEWDEAKSDWTRRERGFGFDTAVEIFAGPVVEWEDRRQDWGEDRVVAVGIVNGRFLTVIYTNRAERRRIISARASRKREKERWLSSARP
jgi:uncharacterized DUF497 family protein